MNLNDQEEDLKDRFISRITGAELVAALEELGFLLEKIEHRQAICVKGNQRVTIPLGVLSGDKATEVRKSLRPVLTAYSDSALPVYVVDIKKWVNEPIHSAKSDC